MKRLPYSPALDVPPVSLIADGIVPFWTPIMISASVRWYFSFLLCVFKILCSHFLLFLSMWYIGSAEFIFWWCFSLVSVVILQMRSVVSSSSSTWLVSRSQYLCQCVFGKIIFNLFKLIHSAASAVLMAGPRSSYSTFYQEGWLSLFIITWKTRLLDGILSSCSVGIGVSCDFIALWGFLVVILQPGFLTSSWL